MIAKIPGKLGFRLFAKKDSGGFPQSWIGDECFATEG
ncbi:MAG: hypothetical protein SRB2_01910 [Desulfobacteraceae bacterium Eth-SRB2]|nr:MAG: hypothetical protein SRB2_01910 [Desulfobacteraceae bacterium Eth-SRB2]